MACRLRSGLHVTGLRLSGIFQQAYGFHFAGIREMDLSLTYRALAENQVDLIAGQFHRRLDLALRIVSTRRRPALFRLMTPCRWCAEPLGEISSAARSAETTWGILTVEEMRKLNFAVDGEKRQPNEVARASFCGKSSCSIDYGARLVLL